MKLTLITILFFLLGASSELLSENEYVKRFTDFTTKYDKKYTDEEYQLRYNIFKGNIDTIEAHNNEEHSWTMDVNEFADQVWHEFKTKHATYTTSSNLGFWFNDNLSSDVPSEWDWVEKGGVTPVKNQGQCGSCYTFSITGAVEGAWYVNTGELLSLSEQQLVDCSGSFGNQGCNGGEMNNGFEYIIRNGICTETDYPYTATDGTCSLCNSSPVSIYSFRNVAPNNEEALQEAVFQQPVSVALEADQIGWHFYKNGIMDSKCGTNLDHGVLVVGYGTEDGKDYWKVKNSWGTSWGEDGYIRLSRNVEAPQGQCGIAMQPSYPVVGKLSKTVYL